MTQLNCSVRNCNYNEDALCCRDQIKVEGSSATASNETCCGSFAEKRTRSASNRVQEPDPATEVSCKAEKCIYNENEKCGASGIGVAGSNACCCGETECGTFSCKQPFVSENFTYHLERIAV